LREFFIDSLQKKWIMPDALLSNFLRMKFLNPRYENEELTYEDVFLLQNYFE
jgi:hypothetical protein